MAINTKLLQTKKKAVLSKCNMNNLLNELFILFDSNFQLLPINDNTGIKLYTQQKILIADFYYENSDIVYIQLSGNWCKNYRNILTSCILKSFRWIAIPEEQSCCSRFFSRNNKLRFYI